jgi:hypothetical protein
MKETRVSLSIKPGREKTDHEYEKCSVCNVFMVNEPLRGKKIVKITERKTRKDWAEFIKQIADEMYPKARMITLIMDNYMKHILLSSSSLSYLL